MRKTKKSKLILLTILSVFGNLPTMAKETNKNKSVNSNIKKMVGLVSNMPKWSKYTLGFGVPSLAAVLIGGSIYAAKNKKKKLKPIQIKEETQRDSIVEQNENYKFVPLTDIINNPNLKFSSLDPIYVSGFLNLFGDFLYIKEFSKVPPESIENDLGYCKKTSWFRIQDINTTEGPVSLYTSQSENEKGKYWIIYVAFKQHFIYIKEIDKDKAEIAGGFISNLKHV